MRELPLGLEASLMLLTVTAACWDWKTRRIPNWLTAAGAAAGLGLSAAYGIAWFSLEGLALALLIYVPLWLLRAVGGGDAKLMAAVGSITGPGNWIAIFLIAMLTSAVLGVVRAAATRQWEALAESTGRVIANLARGRLPASADPQLDVRHPGANRNPHAVSVALASSVLLALLHWR